MHNHLKEQHIIAMYILAFTGILIIIFNNINSLWLNLLFSILWLFSFSFRNLFLYKTDKYIKLSYTSYLSEFLFLFLLGIFDNGTSVKLLFCLTAADAYINLFTAWGNLYLAISYFFYMLQLILNNTPGEKEFIIMLMKETPVFIFTGIISYLMGRVLKSNILIEKAMKEAEVREIELKSAYNDLHTAYRDLDEMSRLRERNRIAREIHDTVGHTITTVIVEMEAGRMLAESDVSLALEKFRMAKDQASKSLDELRKSVRLLSEEKSNKILRDEIIEIIELSKVHTGVNVKYVIDIPENFEGSTAGLVKRAVKEGLSNGIRHGKSTAFILRLIVENNRLSFLLQDNGIGCKKVIPGFGINNLKKSIEEAGGQVEFRSLPEEGFEMEFSLPLKVYK